jgi:cytochrome b6-f complex iron-sulfur subunit
MSCAACPSRRAVLAGAGAVTAAGLLAACSSGGGEPSGPQATSGADDPVIADLATLREEGSIAFESADGKAIAVAVGDEVVAYSSVCTHNGCTVVWDAEASELSCPCHGSRFDPADGAPTTGPARTPLPAVPVTVDEAEGVLRRG